AALGDCAEPQRQLLDDRLLVAQDGVDAHGGDLVLDGGLGLFTQLDVDDAHRVFGVGELEFAAGNFDVVHDPLDVGLYEDSLPLGADAAGVDKQRLHGCGDDDKRVGERVVAERDTQPDVDGLLVPTPRVDDVDVGRHDDVLPEPDAGDAVIDGPQRRC